MAMEAQGSPMPAAEDGAAPAGDNVEKRALLSHLGW